MTPYDSFRRIVLVGLIVCSLLAVRDAQAANHHVSIKGLSFEPEHLTIAVGDTVTWTSTYSSLFGGQIISAPSVTATGANTFTGCAAIPKGQTCVVTFDAEGFFTYQNDDKAAFGVTGTITVSNNDLPILTFNDATTNMTVLEGVTLSLGGTTSDPDGTIESMSYSIENSEFTNSVDGMVLTTADGDGVHTFASGSSTTNLVVGTNFFVAAAIDNRGGRTEDFIEVIVQENAGPEVTITSPEADSTIVVNPNMTVEVTATDPNALAGDRVTTVEVRLNGALQATVMNTVEGTNAFSVPLSDPVSFDNDGVNVVLVRVTDGQGATTEVSHSFTVMNSAPTVALTLPMDSVPAQVDAALDVIALGMDVDALAGGGIVSVEFFFNDGPPTAVSGITAGMTEFTAKIPAELMTPDSTNALRVVVKDVFGETGVATNTVIVETVIYNAAPTVAFTTPAGELLVARGVPLMVAGVAADPDGVVSQLTMFVENGAGTNPVDLAGFTFAGDNTTFSGSILTDTPPTLFADGVNTLVVVATDDDGRETRATTKVTLIPVKIDVESFVRNDAAVIFTFGVDIGGSYRVESSTDFVNWVTEISFTSTTQSRAFIDFHESEPMRFYRIVRDP